MSSVRAGAGGSHQPSLGMRWVNRKRIQKASSDVTYCFRCSAALARCPSQPFPAAAMGLWPSMVATSYCCVRAMILWALSPPPVPPAIDRRLADHSDHCSWLDARPIRGGRRGVSNWARVLDSASGSPCPLPQDLLEHSWSRLLTVSSTRPAHLGCAIGGESGGVLAFPTVASCEAGTDQRRQPAPWQRLPQRASQYRNLLANAR